MTPTNQTPILDLISTISSQFTHNLTSQQLMRLNLYLEYYWENITAATMPMVPSITSNIRVTETGGNGTDNSTDLTFGGQSGPITWDDATWILTSAFIIFTMQSGELLFLNMFTLK